MVYCNRHISESWEDIKLRCCGLHILVQIKETYHRKCVSGSEVSLHYFQFWTGREWQTSEMSQSQNSHRRLENTSAPWHCWKQGVSTMLWGLLVGEKEVCMETQHHTHVVGILYCLEDSLQLMYTTEYVTALFA